MGQMLRETERNKGAKPGKTGYKALPLLDDTQPTLSSLGLSKRESAESRSAKVTLLLTPPPKP